MAWDRARSSRAQSVDRRNLALASMLATTALFVGCYGSNGNHHAEGGAGGLGGTAGATSSGGATTAGDSSGGGADAAGTSATSGGSGGTSSAGTTGSGGDTVASGGATAGCGDGKASADEACDDGNTLNDDGCSSDCTIEPGFTCSVPVCDPAGDGCSLHLPVTFRDFNASASSGGHPDFAPIVNNSYAIEGLVEPTLDSEGKPVLSSLGISGEGFMHGTDAFAQWYRDVQGVNATIQSEIVLWDNGAGGYVNRWGAGGERWQMPPSYANVLYGGTMGGGCTLCEATAPAQCFDPCPAAGFTGYTCCAEEMINVYDGNPLFFPIDPPTAGILTDTRSEGRVPPNYGSTGWDWESTVATSLGVSTPMPTSTAPFPSTTHNFHFTTELKLLFRYDSTRDQTLEFTGDDDVWVFVNGTLAVDLGGWHPPLDGSITLDATAAETFGLVDGNAYSLAVFHAERQVQGSSFRLTLTGFDLNASVCVPNP